MPSLLTQLTQLISTNVELGPALNLSPWRKIAIGTWRTAGDPSVYGILELKAKPALDYIEKLQANTGKRITLTHFLGKAVAATIAQHPQINCVLRFGKLYPRKTVDVFFQVARDSSGQELSGTTIRNAHEKSMVEIADELHSQVHSIRFKGDPAFRKMKGLMNKVPGFLMNRIMTLTGHLMYALNLWSPLLGVPRDPFGSVMVTNIGSLGLDLAFAPLVPYSRVPVLITLGAVKEGVTVQQGQIVITPKFNLCVTFDHRLIDGVHATQMSQTLQRIVENPEKEFPIGAPSHS